MNNTMNHRLFAALAALVTTACGTEGIVIEMHQIDKDGISTVIGTVTAADSTEGLELRPALGELPPGPHGFHVHENPSCEPGEKDGNIQAGISAGGHHDPAGTGRHEGPQGSGHLGDLPVLTVDEGGKATAPVVAPRLKLADLTGRALLIHAGGDNFSDQPETLGGGGARIACGVIPSA
jgi:superoxide dismutase, Cu-Zn family